MHHLKFSNWNVACWAMLLLWLAFSVLGNYPYLPPDGSTSMDEFAEAALLNGSDSVSMLTGWPLRYLEINYAPGVAPTQSFFPFYVAINLLLSVLVLTGIVVTIQTWVPRFSIRTMLLGMALTAALISLGQFIATFEDYRLHFGFVYAVYFAPLATGLITAIYLAAGRHLSSVGRAAETSANGIS